METAQRADGYRPRPMTGWAVSLASWNPPLRRRLRRGTTSALLPLGRRAARGAAAIAADLTSGNDAERIAAGVRARCSASSSSQGPRCGRRRGGREHDPRRDLVGRRSASSARRAAPARSPGRADLASAGTWARRSSAGTRRPVSRPAHTTSRRQSSRRAPSAGRISVGVRRPARLLRPGAGDPARLRLSSSARSPRTTKRTRSMARKHCSRSSGHPGASWPSPSSSLERSTATSSPGPNRSVATAVYCSSR